jgi:hypothetical protein
MTPPLADSALGRLMAALPRAARGLPAMRGQGGLCARVKDGGVVHVGDAVSVEAMP